MRNTINLIAALAMIVLTVLPCAAQTAQSPTIEVTGSATVNIVPDRITIEIGMEEYYDPVSGGDSVIVKLADIEKKVRAALHGAGIADKDIVMTDMGNYRDREMKNGFLMAKNCRPLSTISARSTGLPTLWGVRAYRASISPGSTIPRWSAIIVRD